MFMYMAVYILAMATNPVLLIVQLLIECGNCLVTVSDQGNAAFTSPVSFSTVPILPPLCSLCIIYLMVAIGNWASVSVVAVVGPKISLIVTGFLYV